MRVSVSGVCSTAFATCQSVRPCPSSLDVSVCVASSMQVLIVHKAFLKRKRPLYAKRQEAIEHVPDFWLKVVSREM